MSDHWQLNRIDFILYHVNIQYTGWKHVFRNFCKCIKNQKVKSLIYISTQTLNSVLWRSPFGSVYGFESSWVSSSFAHLDLGSLSHSSWQTLSSSIRLDAKCDVAIAMLHHRDGISQVMSSPWCIRPENLFAHALRVQLHLANSKWAVMPFLLEWLLCSHSTIKAWLMECCWDGCTYARFSHLCRGLPKFS